MGPFGPLVLVDRPQHIGREEHFPARNLRVIGGVNLLYLVAEPPAHRAGAKDNKLTSNAASDDLVDAKLVHKNLL